MRVGRRAPKCCRMRIGTISVYRDSAVCEDRNSDSGRDIVLLMNRTHREVLVDGNGFLSGFSAGAWNFPLTQSWRRGILL